MPTADGVGMLTGLALTSFPWCFPECYPTAFAAFYPASCASCWSHLAR